MIDPRAHQKYSAHLANYGTGWNSVSVGVSSAMAADIAAAAASAMGAAVVAAVPAMRAAAVAAQGASVAGCNLDHLRGASLSVCRGGLAHGLHLQPRFGRRPYEQRLARGLKHSSSLDPTGSSPPKQSHLPGLSNQVHLLFVQTNLIGNLGR